jgi:RNA polymerase sigma factor (sigma-70 family)
MSDAKAARKAKFIALSSQCGLLTAFGSSTLGSTGRAFMPLSDPDIQSEIVAPVGGGMDDRMVRLRKPLYRYFLRRTNIKEDAEDLTQEVFVRLSRQGDLQAVGNVAAFVFSIAANLLTDFYRQAPRKSAERPINGQDLEIADDKPEPSRVIENRQHLEVLLSAIKSLPPRRRAVFVMHRFEGMSHSAIAAALGISISGVEKHIAAAVVHLATQAGGSQDG